MEKSVLTADRGFASFHFFLHAERVGCRYVVRANDAYVRNLLGTASLPDALDTHITLYLTRSRAKEFFFIIYAPFQYHFALCKF
ncbi:MAG: hypothetical protein II687_07330 [Selenomonadaceae bacterium]|nr:hypothetical protein [Selenomonadaceae bacterium]